VITILGGLCVFSPNILCLVRERWRLGVEKNVNHEVLGRCNAIACNIGKLLSEWGF
jgi:hypothetical protein